MRNMPQSKDASTVQQCCVERVLRLRRTVCGSAQDAFLAQKNHAFHVWRVGLRRMSSLIGDSWPNVVLDVLDVLIAFGSQTHKPCPHPRHSNEEEKAGNRAVKQRQTDISLDKPRVMHDRERHCHIRQPMQVLPALAKTLHPPLG